MCRLGDVGIIRRQIFSGISDVSISEEVLEICGCFFMAGMNSWDICALLFVGRLVTGEPIVLHAYNVASLYARHRLLSFSNPERRPLRTVKLL